MGSRQPEVQERARGGRSPAPRVPQRLGAQGMNRRQFLQQAAAGAAGAGFWIAGRQIGYGQEKSASARLNVGHIGVAGMRGADHLAQMSSQNIFALCDVDEKNLEQAAAKFPKAARYH